MELYSSNQTYKLFHWNMLDLWEVIEDCSIDSIVTDPPYELNFMWKWWDNSWIAFQPDTWKKCLDALKPWGYLLAFGGSRTYHRIACAIEDAGFEIRDCIMWLYGSWFPKSMNIWLAIDKKNWLQWQRWVWGFNVWWKWEQENRKAKLHIWSTTDWSKQPWYSDYKSDLAKLRAWWGTALKPSYEPIIVARKPLEWSCTDNVIKYWVGGINIDECRVGNEVITQLQKDMTKYHGNKLGAGHHTQMTGITTQTVGRFPANTILTYDENDFEEVCGGFPNTKSTYNKDSKHETEIHRENADTLKYGYKTRIDSSSYNDSGSASRYFYCAKASKKDRDEGLEDFIPTTDKAKGNGLDRVCEFCGVSQLTPELCHCETKSWITKPKKNTHPTVKPTDLMQYLVRLVNPNGATILDPFNGSGSTGKAVMYENRERNKNYKYIGIELTEEYLPIAKARIEYVCKLNEEELKEMQMTIFDILEE